MADDLIDRIPIAKLLAYAAPAFALAVVGIPVYVYIPKFYTDVIGVNITVMGVLISAVRIFDAITDPLLGFLSDKTQTRYGRRRPYIVIGSIFLAISIFMLFNPPAASPAFGSYWFALWIFLLFLFWTVVAVPYESLGPEITFDYNERSKLFGFRDGALIVGTLVAASSPALINWALDLSADAAGERNKFFWISVFYAPLIVVFCGWCVFTIHEKVKSRKEKNFSFIDGFRLVAYNRPFLILLISYTISALGNNLPATLILFYVQYVLLSSRADLFLLIYFVTGVLFLPAWIRLSVHLGKKITWIVSMGVNTGAFVGVFFLGPQHVWIYGVLVFISGIGLGATLAIPSAMQADVIDYDELRSGQRREGHYVGLWAIAKKLAAALGVGVALYVLGLSGYTPNVMQTDAVVLTLRILYALVPSLCNIVAILIALAYPIDQETHEKIKRAIVIRTAGDSVEDPLRPGQMIVP
jgi:GPH family glycoside/pentoside/hexuronide:cation symporter